MEDQLSRRELLKKTVAGVSTAALFHAARWPASPSAASESAVAPASAGPANASAVLPLTSTSEVFIPPQGRSFFKFSFDFPERSEEHTSELQSQSNLVCRLLLEKKTT